MWVQQRIQTRRFKKTVIKSQMHFVSALIFSAKDVRDPEADKFLPEADGYL